MLMGCNVGPEMPASRAPDDETRWPDLLPSDELVALKAIEAPVYPEVDGFLKEAEAVRARAKEMERPILSDTERELLAQGQEIALEPNIEEQ